MIGGDHEQRRPRERRQAVDEAVDRAIDGARLGVVAIDGGRRRRQLVRLVRLVRIEVVQPEERARLAVRGGQAHALERGVGERVGRLGARVGPGDAEVRLGVVDERAATVEEEARRVEVGGVPAGGAQPLGERRRAIVEVGRARARS